MMQGRRVARVGHGNLHLQLVRSNFEPPEEEEEIGEAVDESNVDRKR